MENCKNCNIPMIQKQGRFGDFLACPNYPNCRFTIKLNNIPQQPQQPQTQPQVVSTAVVEAPKPKKEFHLTDEAIRSNALESAIKVTKKTGTEDYFGDLFGMCKGFESYIRTGEIW